MVLPVNHYYIRYKGVERGPFTLNQISNMWSVGAITADSFYRVSNTANWTPVSHLEETFNALRRGDIRSDLTEEGGISPSPGEEKVIATKLIHPSPLDSIPLEQRIAARKAAMAAIDPTGEKSRTVQGVLQEILKQGEKCWFSGYPSRNEVRLRIPLYYLTYSSLLGRRKEWQQTVVEIPRSIEAANLHRKQYLCIHVSTWSCAIAAGLISSHWVGPYGILWFAGGLLGGYVVGNLLVPLTPKDWKKFDDWKLHPTAVERLKEGWSDKRP